MATQNDTTRPDTVPVSIILLVDEYGSSSAATFGTHDGAKPDDHPSGIAPGGAFTDVDEAVAEGCLEDNLAGQVQRYIVTLHVPAPIARRISANVAPAPEGEITLDVEEQGG